MDAADERRFDAFLDRQRTVAASGVCLCCKKTPVVVRMSICPACAQKTLQSWALTPATSEDG